MTTTAELAEIRRAPQARLMSLATLSDSASPESDRWRAGRLARLELGRRRWRDLGNGEEQRRCWLEQDALVDEATAS